MGYHVIKINIPRPTSCQVCWIGRWKKFSFSQIKKKGKKVVHKKINQKDLRMRYTCCRCDGPRDGGRKSGSRGRLQRCARIKQLCPSVRPSHPLPRWALQRISVRFSTSTPRSYGRCSTIFNIGHIYIYMHTDIYINVRGTGCSGKIVFFHTSLQPLPRLHRCKRLSKLSTQWECTVTPIGW